MPEATLDVLPVLALVAFDVGFSPDARDAKLVTTYPIFSGHLTVGASSVKKPLQSSASVPRAIADIEAQ